jgi:hypothetical protein
MRNVVLHSLQIEIGSTQRRVHKKFVQASIGRHRWRRGFFSFFIKGIEGFFEQLVRVMEVTFLYVRVHALYQLGLMYFQVNFLSLLFILAFSQISAAGKRIAAANSR